MVEWVALLPHSKKAGFGIFSVCAWVSCGCSGFPRQPKTCTVGQSSSRWFGPWAWLCIWRWCDCPLIITVAPAALKGGLDAENTFRWKVRQTNKDLLLPTCFSALLCSCFDWLKGGALGLVYWWMGHTCVTKSSPPQPPAPLLLLLQPAYPKARNH